MIKRLLRDFKSKKIWVIAIVILIALSSGIYSSFRSCYDSGIQSLDNAEKELNSPDITVCTLPIDDLSSDIKNIPGVSMVSSAFVTDCYTFADDRKVRGEINGIEIGERVNNYHILKGKDIKKNSDVVVEHHYADLHNIKVGQEITLYIYGKAMNFKVCGICFSPSYIYLISPEGWIESDFGIFYVSKKAITKYINTFYILSDEDKIDETASNIKSFFENREINAVVKPVNKTFIYTAFREDISAMNSLADIFSILLLTISAFVLFVILSRFVEKKRHEIGTLRAMGFTKWNIFSYYLCFSGIAVILGLILSIPIGHGLLSFMMNYFAFTMLAIPKQFIAYNLNLSYIVYAAIFAIIFSVIGAFFPSYRAASFTPAEAMRAYIASKKGTRIMSKYSVTPTKKLIFRDMLGHRARSISTIVVIALVFSLGVSFALSMNSFDEGINQRFDRNELWDIKVSFDKPQMISVLDTLKKIPSVGSIEPYIGCGAEISYKNKSIIIQLNKLNKNTKMYSFVEGTSNGVIISGDVAHRLDASVGDRVTISTPFERKETEISGIFQEFGSSEGYILENLTTSTGALLKVKNGEIKNVEKSLQNMPFVKSWVRKEELREGWLGLMSEYYGMVYVWDIVTVILVLIVIGVFAFISMTEREWDFVILKSMGFSNWNILRGSLLETLLFSLIGVLLGMPLGIRVATLFNTTFEILISPPPIVLDSNVVISRSLIIIGISLLTVFLVIRFTLKRNVAEKLRRVFETM